MHKLDVPYYSSEFKSNEMREYSLVAPPTLQRTWDLLFVLNPVRKTSSLLTCFLFSTYHGFCYVWFEMGLILPDNHLSHAALYPTLHFCQQTVGPLQATSPLDTSHLLINVNEFKVMNSRDHFYLFSPCTVPASLWKKLHCT
jgi:hypothetical protein